MAKSFDKLIEAQQQLIAILMENKVIVFNCRFNIKFLLSLGDG
jgi:hypothetical protein